MICDSCKYYYNCKVYDLLCNTRQYIDMQINSCLIRDKNELEDKNYEFIKPMRDIDKINEVSKRIKEIIEKEEDNQSSLKVICGICGQTCQTVYICEECGQSICDNCVVNLADERILCEKCWEAF